MIFAQEGSEAESTEAKAPGERKNAISLDLIPLFKGIIALDSDADTGFFCMALGYERLIAPHFTIGAEIDLYPGQFWDVDYMYFSLAAVGRYYPMSERLEKLYLGTHVGFNVQAIDGKTGAEYGGFSGLLIGLEAGYKLMLGKMFFVEPSMSYTYSKSGELFGMVPLNLGWQAGLRIGISF
jgi:hypothetical protein